MICPPCREAGHINADANRVYDEASAEYLYTRATVLHGYCEQPETCSCQHKLGKVRNERGDG